MNVANLNDETPVCPDCKLKYCIASLNRYGKYCSLSLERAIFRLWERLETQFF